MFVSKLIYIAINIAFYVLIPIISENSECAYVAWKIYVDYDYLVYYGNYEIVDISCVLHVDIIMFSGVSGVF